MTRRKQIIKFAVVPVTKDQVVALFNANRKNILLECTRLVDKGFLARVDGGYVSTKAGLAYLSKPTSKEAKRLEKIKQKEKQREAKYTAIITAKGYEATPQTMTGAYGVNKVAAPVRKENEQAMRKRDTTPRPASFSPLCLRRIDFKGTSRKCAGVGVPKVGDPICGPCWDRVVADRTKAVNT